MSEQQINYKELYEMVNHINRSVNLVEFVEKLTGSNAKWRNNGQSAIMNCPMNWHRDRNASFHMSLMDNELWVFHCFGCHTKGKAVQFYMDYTGEEDIQKAVVDICNKFSISKISDPYTYKSVSRRINKKRELETSHILVANQCRLLLRRDFSKNKLWVKDAYMRLNDALSIDDRETVEKIGYEAARRVNE